MKIVTLGDREVGEGGTELPIDVGPMVESEDRVTDRGR